MDSFTKFLSINGLKKKDIAAYLGVSNAFITQLCNGTRTLPADKLALIKANSEWDTSMLEPGRRHKLIEASELLPGLKAHSENTSERKGRGGKKTHTPLFPDISQYWCRHTWATIAAELDIPKETIAAALGHDMGNTTTAIYINFNQKKVDEANRRVIDFLNEK